MEKKERPRTMKYRPSQIEGRINCLFYQEASYVNVRSTNNIVRRYEPASRIHPETKIVHKMAVASGYLCIINGVVYRKRRKWKKPTHPHCKGKGTFCSSVWVTIQSIFECTSFMLRSTVCTHQGNPWNSPFWNTLENKPWKKLLISLQNHKFVFSSG